MSDAQETVKHPAKFNAGILKEIAGTLWYATEGHLSILDPFGGIGGVHELDAGERNWSTYAIEIEPEWAHQSMDRGWTWCGDFFDFDTMNSLFCCVGSDDQRYVGTGPEIYDAIVTSPTYGNRMADKHVPGPNDKSKRLTYRHTLERDLTDNNSGGMQWGTEYRVFHAGAWAKVRRLLKPGGLFLLNVKDHVRRGELVQVSAWHRDHLRMRGWKLLDDIYIPVRGMGFGQNQTLNEGLKVDYEHLYVFRKEA